MFRFIVKSAVFFVAVYVWFHVAFVFLAILAALTAP